MPREGEARLEIRMRVSKDTFSIIIEPNCTHCSGSSSGLKDREGSFPLESYTNASGTQPDFGDFFWLYSKK
jgi:hypothetical protein